MTRKRAKNPDQEKPKPPAARLDEAAVLAALRSAGRPLRRPELLRALRVGREGKRDLRSVLARLEGSGRVIRTKGGALGLTDSMHLITGRLEIQRSGVGFVIPEDKRRQDVFISPASLGEAWHGDKVVAALIPGAGKAREGKPVVPGRRAEGRIVRVLERGRKELPCAVARKVGPGVYLCRATDPKFPVNFMLEAKAAATKPRPGDILLVKPGDKLEAGLYLAKSAEVLGPEEDPDVQERLVKAAHGVPGEFPPSALAEAAALPLVPAEADFAGREDLRQLPLVTIDGETARDFDDAVCVERAGRGWRLRVAIADVAHYVRPGSGLDREAQTRGNSYYFPRSVEPMFPERLSNGLCSLNPKVPRLCMVAELCFGAGGQITEERFYPGVMRSAARLTYTQVSRALEDNDPAEQKALGKLLPMLREAQALAKVLRAGRLARGSLDFDLPEAMVLFDDSGRTTDIAPRPRTFAHQLIEEFMLAANEAVARLLTGRGAPCAYRVHEAPDQEKLRAAVGLLQRTPLGPRLPRLPEGDLSPRQVQSLLAAAKGTDQDYLAGRLLLRTMMQARYQPKNLGHFGLASDCYCHFTSPIRRYADLLVHRSLKAALAGETPPLPAPPKLREVCERISDLERVAMDAEREILKRLTVLHLESRVGEDFTGVVSGLSDFGFWVELDGVMAEGLVRLSSLTDDYYAYLPERQEIWGRQTRRRFGLGLPVNVTLTDVNLSRLEVNLSLR